MIHIITIHFQTNKWIDIQLKQIDKHVSDYKVWTYCDGFDHLPHKDKFYFCQKYSSNRKEGYLDHMEKLNSLTSDVLNDKKTKDTDILIWLDSDSFPIKDLNDYIKEKLIKYPLIAINRLENNGDIIPHPSFTCTSVSFWKKHKLNWDGFLGENYQRLGKGLHDSGGRIYKVLLEKNIEWYKLLRTSSLTKHQVFFTIYDDLIYHHGAGSRESKGCRGGSFGVSYNDLKSLDKKIFQNINLGKSWLFDYFKKNKHN